MFKNTTMVTALIDRLTFRTHVLNMKGESYHLQASPQGRDEYAAYPWRNIRSELYSQSSFGGFLCDPECDIILPILLQHPIEIKYAGRRITHCSISLKFSCRHPLLPTPFLPPHYIYEIYKPIVTVFSKKISNFSNFFVFRKTPRLHYLYSRTMLGFGRTCTGMSGCQNVIVEFQILLALS